MDARNVLTFAVVLASVAACFSDLPAATKCPADPQRVVGNCFDVLKVNPKPGCVPKAAHECLIGPREDCACGASECPDTTSSCYPALECPELVRKQVPGATCPKLVSADATNCACGCANCVAVCDGYGPSLGVLIPEGMPAQPLLRIPLAGLLPQSGKLGFYVRLRGASTMVAGFVFGGVTKVEDALGLVDFQASGTPFHEMMIGVSGPVRAAWSTLDQAPDSIIFAALPGSGSDPGITYAQIDCVIPVLLP